MGGATADGPSLGLVTAISRFPVKSLAGEDLDVAEVDERGLVGDRLWAVRDGDGKLGSGKSTRRFRRMSGLLDLSARYDADDEGDERLVPSVRFPDGRVMRADRRGIEDALSAYVGRPVTLEREADTSHFDEASLHIATVGSIARLGELSGSPVDPRRLRANLVIDSGGDARFDEHDWVGRDLVVGAEVVVRARKPMERCVMVTLPQADLPAANGLLATLGRVNDTNLGLVVDVLRPGTVHCGDTVRGSPGRP